MGSGERGAPAASRSGTPAAPVDALLLAATALWALNAPAVKIGIAGISPILFPVVRFLPGGLALLVLLRVREGSIGVARRDMGLIALTGLLGVTINQACYVYALTNTGASDVAFLWATGPLMTALLATIIGLERLSRRHWLSALAGLVGTAMIVGGRVYASPTATPLLGAGLTLLSVFASSASALPIRHLLGRYSPWRILAWELLIGTLLLLPFAAPQAATEAWDRVSASAWLALAYTIVFTGVFANVLYFTAIGRVGPSRAAIFGYLQSMLSVVFAVLLLGESVLPIQIAGGVVVIGSVVWSRRGAQHAAEPSSQGGLARSPAHDLARRVALRFR